MSEWKEYKLGDICDVRDGTHDSPKQSAIGKPLVTSKNIKSGNIGLENTYLISEKDFVNINKRSKVDRYDILFSMIGTVGESAIVKDEPDYAIKNVGLFKTGGDESLAKWVYYYLKSNQAQGEIDANLKGSTQQYISLSDLRKFPIEMPNPEVQKQIIEILSSLDDKIDLLTRQNRTLETMAETLFRQYFIENPKSDWKDSVIADIAKHSKIAIHPQKQPTELFCHYSIPSFDNAKTPTLDLGVEIQSSKYKVPSNSVLFSKLNPHKDKRVWLLPNSVHDNSICSTEFQIIEPINKEYLYFTYGWLTHSENYNDIASGVGGTSGSHQRIDPATIFSFTCPIIDIDYIRLYNSQVKPMFEKQINNQQQIRSLTKLRDTLLPKLMNNEIRIY